MIYRILRVLRKRRARQRLDRITKERANSYEIISYRKHREAALRGHANRNARTQAMFSGGEA